MPAADVRPLRAAIGVAVELPSESRGARVGVGWPKPPTPASRVGRGVVVDLESIDDDAAAGEELAESPRELSCLAVMPEEWRRRVRLSDAAKKKYEGDLGKTHRYTCWLATRP